MALEGAVGLVNNGYSFFTGIASSQIGAANSYLNALAATAFEVPTFNITFNPPTNDVEFALPPAPVTPPTTITIPAAPSAPSISVPSFSGLPAAPEFDGTPPQISLPSTPSPLSAQAPGDAPALTEVAVPTFAAPALPMVPSLRPITLPPSPTITVPTFSSSIPDLVIDFPPVAFSFNEDYYDSTLLGLLRTRITDMVNGATGLPAVVEDALFERARAREEKTSFAAQQEVTDEWASRGFSLPSGVVSQRLAEIREKNRISVNTLQRDIMVQMHQAALEQLKVGVQSGIELEGQLMNYAGAFAERALRANQILVETSVSIFNAQVGLFTARLARTNALIAVFEGRLKGELAKLEIQKNQLEAQQLVGQLNEQDVRIYVAKFEGVRAAVEAYKAQIDGVKAQVDVDRSRVEVFRARVEAFGEQVQAKQAEFTGYAAAVQAEASKGQIYESAARAYAARVQGFEAAANVQVSAQRVAIEAAGLQVQVYNGNIQAFGEQVRAEAARIQGVVGIFDGQARMYSALLGAEGARVESTARAFEASLEAERAQATLAASQLQAQAQVTLQAAGLVAESQKGAAAVAAQIAAGAMSAVNLAAGISGQDSTSTNYNLSGDAPSPPAA